ncbi:hypothetical protein D9M68_367140 [compost metagenome]
MQVVQVGGDLRRAEVAQHLCRAAARGLQRRQVVVEAHQHRATVTGMQKRPGNGRLGGGVRAAGIAPDHLVGRVVRVELPGARLGVQFIEERREAEGGGQLGIALVRGAAGFAAGDIGGHGGCRVEVAHRLQHAGRQRQLLQPGRGRFAGRQWCRVGGLAGLAAQQQGRGRHGGAQLEEGAPAGGVGARVGGCGGFWCSVAGHGSASLCWRLLRWPQMGALSDVAGQLLQGRRVMLGYPGLIRRGRVVAHGSAPGRDASAAGAARGGTRPVTWLFPRTWDGVTANWSKKWLITVKSFSDCISNCLTRNC